MAGNLPISNNRFFKERFKQQKLHSIRLAQPYLLESLSLISLDLHDRNGNQLALYQSDYKKLNDYLKSEEGVTLESFKHLPIEKKVEILCYARVKVIKYFSTLNLKNCELNVGDSDFGKTGNIVTRGGLLLIKGDHENCVIMQNNRIYVHPKIRSKLGDIASEVGLSNEVGVSNPVGLIGVSHSSLSSNKRVQFAGAFFHTEKRGWVLDNSSGHYTTRPYQLRIFLEKLAEQGVKLEEITVRMFISKTGKTNPTDTDDNFDIYYENAEAFLSRVQKSLKSSTILYSSTLASQTTYKAVISSFLYRFKDLILNNPPLIAAIAMAIIITSIFTGGTILAIPGLLLIAKASMLAFCSLLIIMGVEVTTDNKNHAIHNPLVNSKKRTRESYEKVLGAVPLIPLAQISVLPDSQAEPGVAESSIMPGGQETESEQRTLYSGTGF